MAPCFSCRALTCRNDGFQLGAVDEGPFDGLSFDVGPVDPLLCGVVVHHRDIVDIWHGQSRHDVHVRVIYVHTTDFRAPHVQEEPFHCCQGQEGRPFICCLHASREKMRQKKDVGSGLPKHDCLLGESFMRCGQVQDAVRL